MIRHYNIEKWIAAYLLGALSAKERDELEKWIEESPENEKKFTHLLSEEKFTEQYNQYNKVDSKAAWVSFRNKTRSSAFRIEWSTFVRYAAILLLPLTVAYFFWWTPGQQKQMSQETILPGASQAVLLLQNGNRISLNAGSGNQIPVGYSSMATASEEGISYTHADNEAVDQYNTLLTPRGGEYRVTLSDGTIVHLNSASRLKYPVTFSKNKRVVHLEGEAYFNVAEDKKRPFYVVTDGLKIRQYGTSFNVNTYSSRYIDVVLVSGSIGVIPDSGKEEQELKPGQKAEFNRSLQTVSVTDIDVESYVAWNDGRFVFEDESLENIMQTLSRWYDVDIRFGSPQLRNLHFTGSVDRYETIDRILKAIAYTVDVQFDIQERTVYISK
ncbi:FecR domain-containing protein [Coprobacter sp.]